LHRSRTIAPALAKHKTAVALVALVFAAVMIEVNLPNPPLSKPSAAKLTTIQTPVLTPANVPDVPSQAHLPKHRLQSAPNGESWPTTSGYVPGGPKRGVRGSSTVTIDNTGGGFDAFVKLVSNPEGARPRSVSWVLVRSGDLFTVDGVRPGTYAMYYQDLASGATDKSPVLQLEEDQQGYSVYRITLYTLVDGNIQMRPIDSDEFLAVDKDTDLTAVRN
jgi:hypothetical protein